MKILWSDFASEMLFEIFEYYREVAGEKIAMSILTKIFDATNQLLYLPDSGQIESNLKQLGENHRYLVSGNYKIIYKGIPEGLLITDVFDTRQNPIKMNDPKRKNQF